MNSPDKKRKRSSIRKLESSAKKGNVKALWQLSDYYQKGQYVEQNTELADKYLDSALELFQGQSLKILSIKLVSFRGFEEISLDFNSKSNVTVIIGNNGAGKTTILEAIEHNLSWLTNRILREKATGKSIDAFDINNSNSAAYAATVTKLSILDNLEYEIGLSTPKKGSKTSRRNSVEEIGELASLYKQANDRNSQFNFPIMAYYSVERAVEVKKKDVALIDDLKVEETLGKFEGYHKALNGSTDFKLFFHWFRNLEDIRNAKFRDRKDLAIEIEKLEDKILLLTNILESSGENDLSRETILAQKFESKSELESLKNQLAGGQDNLENKIISVVTTAIYKFMGEKSVDNLRIQRSPQSDMLIDKNNLTLSILQLSQGEKSLMALIADIARRLVLLNPSLENPLNGNGIVLIDEIDLHLHPKWQRIIIKQLTTVFPNCQFILSSHSPLMISDCKDVLAYLIDEGEIKELPSLFGQDVNSVLLDVMDTGIRNAEINTELNDLFDLIHDSRITEAKSALETLELKLPSNNVELLKASLLLRKQELRREKN